MAPTNYYDRCNMYPKGGGVENPYHMHACIHYLVFYSSPHQWQLLFEGNLKYSTGSTHDKCSPKVRKGVEVSALKFLTRQYLRKVPQLSSTWPVAHSLKSITKSAPLRLWVRYLPKVVVNIPRAWCHQPRTTEALCAFQCKCIGRRTLLSLKIFTNSTTSSVSTEYFISIILDLLCECKMYFILKCNPWHNYYYETATTE